MKRWQGYTTAKTKKTFLGCFLSLLLLWPPVVYGSSFFQRQVLGNPYEGQHTGLAWADLNNDGAPDLLVSAGKHWIDQSYVLINLGTKSSDGTVIFSDPLPMGPPGGYYQVEAVTQLSFLSNDDHFGVLLAGGSCTDNRRNRFGFCMPGTHTPAILLDVVVTGGCSILQPQRPCQLSWSIIWKDFVQQGDRNGAFSYELGNGGDPAIVLVGGSGVTIYEPPYQGFPTFTIANADKLPQNNDRITRSTGLAVGVIGTHYQGFFVGTRTEDLAPPAPIIGVWKTGLTDYAWYSISSDNDAYFGNPENIAVQAIDLVLVDLNGDGIMDVVEANHVGKTDMAFDIPVQQDYYLLDWEGFPIGGPVSFAWEQGGGRSLAWGNIFPNSFGPDLALGTGDGQVVLFANLGNSWDGEFLGFEERHRLMVADGCEIRDVIVVPSLASPCATSVVASAYCGARPHNGGVFAFHDIVTACPGQASVPTQAPTQSPTSEPTILPTTTPTRNAVPTGKVPTGAPMWAKFPTTISSVPSNAESPLLSGIPTLQEDRVEVQVDALSSARGFSSCLGGVVVSVTLLSLHFL